MQIQEMNRGSSLGDSEERVSEVKDLRKGVDMSKYGMRGKGCNQSQVNEKHSNSMAFSQSDVIQNQMNQQYFQTENLSFERSNMAYTVWDGLESSTKGSSSSQRVVNLQGIFKGKKHFQQPAGRMDEAEAYHKIADAYKAYKFRQNLSMRKDHETEDHDTKFDKTKIFRQSQKMRYTIRQSLKIANTAISQLENMSAGDSESDSQLSEEYFGHLKMQKAGYTKNKKMSKN